MTRWRGAETKKRLTPPYCRVSAITVSHECDCREVGKWITDNRVDDGSETAPPYALRSTGLIPALVPNSLAVRTTLCSSPGIEN